MGLANALHAGSTADQVDAAVVRVPLASAAAEAAGPLDAGPDVLRRRRKRQQQGEDGQGEEPPHGTHEAAASTQYQVWRVSCRFGRSDST